MSWLPSIFTPGSTYSKQDIYDLLGVPASQQAGKWMTGYCEHEGTNFIFANVGVAGRTGHDYGNRWEDDLFVWQGKTGSKAGHESIRRMTSGDEPVLLFTRGGDRDPWRYEGRVKAEKVVAETSPVEVHWNLVGDARKTRERIPDLFQFIEERTGIDLQVEGDVKFFFHTGDDHEYLRRILVGDHSDIAQPGVQHHPKKGQVWIEMARLPRDGFEYVLTGAFRLQSDPRPHPSVDGWCLVELEPIDGVEAVAFEIVMKADADPHVRLASRLGKLEERGVRFLHERGVRGAVATALGVDIDRFVTEHAVRKLSRSGVGQGFSADPARNKAVELHAMAVAGNWLKEEHGFTDDQIENTSATKPYDLVGRRGAFTRYVEVKGTTGGGEHVLVTAGEVRWAREYSGECVLLVVSGIEVSADGDGGWVASGGHVEVVVPWVPADDELEAVSYRHTVRR